MKNLTLLLITAFSCVFLAAGCSNPERTKAAGEEAKGTVQQAQGDLTGDNSKKAEGVWNKTKGKARDTKEDVKDLVS